MPDLIATPGADDANSFADLDQAEEFVSYEPVAVSEAWDDIDEDTQTRALLSASSDIDALPWDALRGDFPSSSDQALSWPRGGATTNPRNLVRATVLLAVDRSKALSDEATTDDVAALSVAPTSNIQEDTVGPITTKFFKPSDDQTALSAFPPRVQLLLSGLVKPVSSTSQWGTGTAVRAS